MARNNHVCDDAVLFFADAVAILFGFLESIMNLKQLIPLVFPFFELLPASLSKQQAR